MVCDKCGKELTADKARHCGGCGKDYCPDCAGGICDCADELSYYS